MSCRSRLLLL
uniref:Uncharacterized protein n=1 Tax=Arundo donax TaxID=35708 RepID=A0A0A9HBP0_ARUDO